MKALKARRWLFISSSIISSLHLFCLLIGIGRGKMFSKVVQPFLLFQYPPPPTIIDPRNTSIAQSPADRTCAMAQLPPMSMRKSFALMSSFLDRPSPHTGPPSHSQWLLTLCAVELIVHPLYGRAAKVQERSSQAKKAALEDNDDERPSKRRRLDANSAALYAAVTKKQQAQTPNDKLETAAFPKLPSLFTWLSPAANYLDRTKFVGRITIMNRKDAISFAQSCEKLLKEKANGVANLCYFGDGAFLSENKGKDYAHEPNSTGAYSVVCIDQRAPGGARPYAWAVVPGFTALWQELASLVEMMHMAVVRLRQLSGYRVAFAYLFNDSTKGLAILRDVSTIGAGTGTGGLWHKMTATRAALAPLVTKAVELSHELNDLGCQLRLHYHPGHQHDTKGHKKADMAARMARMMPKPFCNPYRMDVPYEPVVINVVLPLSIKAFQDFAKSDVMVQATDKRVDHLRRLLAKAESNKKLTKDDEIALKGLTKKVGHLL